MSTMIFRATPWLDDDNDDDAAAAAAGGVGMWDSGLGLGLINVTRSVGSTTVTRSSCVWSESERGR